MPEEMLTEARTLELFAKIVADLEIICQHLAQVPVAGRLNLPQSERVLLSLRALERLQQAFKNEIARQSAAES
jgi:hypothetical protein